MCQDRNIEPKITIQMRMRIGLGETHHLRLASKLSLSSSNSQNHTCVAERARLHGTNTHKEINTV